MQNRSFVSSRVKDVLDKDSEKSSKDILNSYVNETFPSDYKMQQVARPLVEHMITSGMDKSKVDEAMSELFENSYVDTLGIVIDRYNPNNTKSMFGLLRITPDKAERKRYLQNANSYINKRAGGGYDLKEGFQIVEGSKQVKLVPVTNSAFQPDQLEIEYKVTDEMEGREPKILTYNETINTFQFMAFYQDDNGELRMIPDKETGGPIYVGTELAVDDIAAMRMDAKTTEIYNANQKTLKKIELNKRTKSNVDALKRVFGGGSK